ncbi:MAG: bifunctional hydroxymethylpyrimidine kinase/phosphomethylpyrimidine kinase [Pseudomonadota bacterium]
MTYVPAALTIAGSDSSGGAGIQADLKTMTALGVYGASVITALTAQNTTGVQGVHAIPASFVKDQLDSVMNDLDVRAIKTGMLPTSEIIEVIAATFARRPDIPAVVDPVMVATSGDRLIDEAAVQTVRDVLAPCAHLLTPNLQEAAVLLETSVATSRGDMEQQAAALVGLGCRGVLVKGGHFEAETADDAFHDGTSLTWISGPRIDTENTHGTGCTLSSAIASHLVRGHAMPDAIRAAKAYLARALKAGRDRTVGAGRSPVHHLVDHDA